MNTVSTPLDWRHIRKTLPGKTIGFVPTMGNLHAGHADLIKRARKENDIVVVSIFVNPTQFNQASDFQHYPRTLEKDGELLQSLQVDYVFIPSENALYPDNYHVQISEHYLSQELEGAYRPGHFTGMLTIVLKLLNIIQADRAYFGEKDYQQYLLVKKMVEALFLNVDIVACKTVRAADGLALSSRNTRLDEKQRQLAAHFPRLLQSSLDVEAIKNELTALGIKVDYIAEKWERRLGAVWVGEVRLIDNMQMEKIC